MKGKVWLKRSAIAPGSAFWAVKAPPHVVIRLKRVFQRLKAKHADVLVFSDTLDTCRDLEWFLERYPLAISKADREYLVQRSGEQRAVEKSVSAIVRGRYRPRRFALALPPREYQTIAADLALERHGLLIADDLGIGKTVSAICVLAEPAARPAVIVVPAHLPRQWKAEIERFLPGIRCHIVKKGTPYPLKKGPFDVLLTTYSKLSGWSETLARTMKTVIYDEVQELRRGDESQKGRAAQYLSSSVSYRIGLSATPIYNYGGEIHAVIDALQPGALGTWSEFATEWCEGWTDKRKARIADPVALGSYLRDAGMMIRRTRAEVGRELPGLTRIPQSIDCDHEALDDIEGSARELARIILDESGRLARAEQFRASGDLNIMVRQATGVAKAPHVADLVRLLLDSEEKVILYGWHRAVYDIWLDRLKDFRPLLYTGTESPAQKQRASDSFIKGDTRLLILSLRSGTGLDGLQQVCRTVVHGELDWSPGVHEQCDARIFRDGQRDPVMSYFPIAEHGSDPIVADVLGVKRGQIEGVRNLGIADKLVGTDATGAQIRRLAEHYAGRRRP